MHADIISALNSAKCNTVLLQDSDVAVCSYPVNVTCDLMRNSISFCNSTLVIWLCSCCSPHRFDATSKAKSLLLQLLHNNQAFTP